MAGAIAYISRDTDGVHWKKVLEAGLGPVDFRPLDALGDKKDIEIVLAWKPPAGLIASFPDVKLIVSLGMGVDHLLADDRLPAGVPIVRIMDEGLVGQMSEYAIYWALRHHREIDKYAASQRARQWKPEDFVDTIDRRIGVMGLGSIGQDTAAKFAALGFPTAGWSRTARTLPGIETFHDADGFQRFLARTDILVDVLPLTGRTVCRDGRGRAAVHRPHVVAVRLLAVAVDGLYLVDAAQIDAGVAALVRPHVVAQPEVREVAALRPDVCPAAAAVLQNTVLE